MDCCAKKTSWFRRLASTVLGTDHCHTSASQTTGALEKLAMVGSPNVGKSVLFNALTGAYVTVSNYPGTTVEVSRGKCRLANQDFELIDSLPNPSCLDFSGAITVRPGFMTCSRAGY